MDALVISVVALFVIGYALISRHAQQTIVSAPMVFVAFGFLIGDGGLGLLSLNRGAPVIHLLAELTLIIILFTDASRIDLKLLRKEYAIPQRLLLLGLPLCIMAGTIVALVVFKTFNIWEGLVLAAILAPTDAALGQAVVSSPRIPVRIRQALNVESGLNDGIALPIVLLGICLVACTHNEGNGYWIRFSILQVTLGPLVGIAVGYFGGKLIDAGQRNNSMTHAFKDLAILSLGLGAFALAELVHGNGFISVFCAGLVLGNTVRSQCDCLYDFSETEGQLMSLLIFMAFGAAMVPAALEHLTGTTILYAVLSLTLVRLIPAAISLAGMKLRPDTQLFLGWFGPRGIASILFVLLVLEEAELAAGEQIFSIVVFTVLLSIVAHGMTAMPATRWYAARLGKKAHLGMKEHEHVTEMPTRIRWNGN
ncbi:MAG: sodium:proton antiporter [Pontiella sp.]